MIFYLQPIINKWCIRWNDSSKNFDMKYMNDVSYVTGIKIHRDRSRGILSLSQETYINKILKRFRIKNYSPSMVVIMKGNKLSLNNISYASIVGSFM